MKEKRYLSKNKKRLWLRGSRSRQRLFNVFDVQPESQHEKLYLKYYIILPGFIGAELSQLKVPSIRIVLEQLLILDNIILNIVLYWYRLVFACVRKNY